jgi:hypothetical protein
MKKREPICSIRVFVILTFGSKNLLIVLTYQCIYLIGN